jgi:Flp pilus assembly protein TadG
VRAKVLRDERGQSTIEFAVVLPLLAIFLFGIIQGGVALNHYLTLTDAVQAAARAASVSTSLTDAQTAANAAAQNASGGLVPSVNVTIPSGTSWGSGVSVTVTATTPYSINLPGVTGVSSSWTSTVVQRIE